MKTSTRWIYQCFVSALGLGLLAVQFSNAKELSNLTADKAHEAIPWSQIGAKAGADYKGDGLAVTASSEGARLRCVFQKLEGEATSEGLWLSSSVTNMESDRFRVVAAAVGRAAILKMSNPITPTLSPSDGERLADRPGEGTLPSSGNVSIDGQTVRFTRPGLVEEYSVSMDGVRQDFLVLEKPAINNQLSTINSPELRLELSVSGARVEQTAAGAQLILDNSGRKIAYSRLRVTDANGKELAARMEVEAKSEIRNRKSEMALAVLVNDEDAVYPVRIDPTFSDANWISIGGVSGPSFNVIAAVVDGSGNLYIGGDFRSVGSVSANYIARWDGSSWSALGAGMSSAVWTLAVTGSELYAGGQFTSAGGNAANYIAKWNGSSWSGLGLGVSSSVVALAVVAGDVIAGGSFATAGGNAAYRIAKWNGSSWSALGLGLSGTVSALAVSGSDVYAGGDFTRATNSGNLVVQVNRVAKWDGSSWSALGSGFNNTVQALAVSGNEVFAGGWFTTATNSGNLAVTVNQIAKWDGSSWSALGAGMSSTVHALALAGSDVIAGGVFTRATNSGNLAVTVNRIAKWDGSSWSALGSGMNFPVYALTVSGSNLYAGGQFTTAGGKTSRYIAQAVLGISPGYNQMTSQLLPGGSLGISYIGYPSTNYALYRTFNLSPPVAWIPQETNTMTISGVTTFTNAPVISTNNFWRIRSVP